MHFSEHIRKQSVRRQLLHASHVRFWLISCISHNPLQPLSSFPTHTYPGIQRESKRDFLELSHMHQVHTCIYKARHRGSISCNGDAADYNLDNGTYTRYTSTSHTPFYLRLWPPLQLVVQLCVCVWAVWAWQHVIDCSICSRSNV